MWGLNGKKECVPQADNYLQAIEVRTEFTVKKCN